MQSASTILTASSTPATSGASSQKVKIHATDFTAAEQLNKMYVSAKNEFIFAPTSSYC